MSDNGNGRRPPTATSVDLLRVDDLAMRLRAEFASGETVAVLVVTVGAELRVQAELLYVAGLKGFAPSLVRSIARRLPEYAERIERGDVPTTEGED